MILALGWGVGALEREMSQVQGQPSLHSDFRASLNDRLRVHLRETRR